LSESWRKSIEHKWNPKVSTRILKSCTKLRACAFPEIEIAIKSSKHQFNDSENFYTKTINRKKNKWKMIETFGALRRYTNLNLLKQRKTITFMLEKWSVHCINVLL
jgi:hypothetical protein